MPAFSLLYAPPVLAIWLLRPTERSPTVLRRVVERPVASVLGLSPVTFSAQDRLTSELLRTL
jgi:hypothetical protein